MPPERNSTPEWPSSLFSMPRLSYTIEESTPPSTLTITSLTRASLRRTSCSDTSQHSITLMCQLYSPPPMPHLWTGETPVLSPQLRTKVNVVPAGLSPPPAPWKVHTKLRLALFFPYPNNNWSTAPSSTLDATVETQSGLTTTPKITHLSSRLTTHTSLVKLKLVVPAPITHQRAKFLPLVIAPLLHPTNKQ